MHVKLFKMIVFAFLASTARADLLGTSNFIHCKSNAFNLTFEINTLFKSIRSINYNQKMHIEYWADDTINSRFPIELSASQVVDGAVETDNVGVNFNRLNGTVTVAGLNSPTAEQISQCEEQRNWGCDDWLVTETYSAQCSIVEPKF